MSKSGRFKILRKSTSKNEEIVLNALKELFPAVVIFTEYPYYRIVNSKISRKLRADIYIQTFNIVIEIQGEHHFKSVYYKTDEESVFKANRDFSERRRLDGLKRKVLKENNVKLLEIPYWEIKPESIKDCLLKLL